MFDNVEIICFAASYGVALLLEISRIFFRAPIRVFVTLAFAILGLVMHTAFLWNHVQPSFAAGVPFSSWHIWWLLAAWIMAAVYVCAAIIRPQTANGVFMLPVVLALVIAAKYSGNETFARAQALSFWSLVHGFSLLLGTVVTALGFVAGLMYLVQSYRLKQKLPPSPGFRLPSLEWLQTVNKQSLYYSSVLLAGGVFAGIVLNMIRQGVPWTDRVVISSGILLAWLFAATLFELFYKPAQQGRKVAYLTVASFVFLAMVLAMLMSGSHAKSNAAQAEVIRTAPHFELDRRPFGCHCWLVQQCSGCPDRLVARLTEARS